MWRHVTAALSLSGLAAGCGGTTYNLGGPGTGSASGSMGGSAGSGSAAAGSSTGGSASGTAATGSAVAGTTTSGTSSTGAQASGSMTSGTSATGSATSGAATSGASTSGTQTSGTSASGTQTSGSARSGASTSGSAPSGSSGAASGGSGGSGARDAGPDSPVNCGLETNCGGTCVDTAVDLSNCGGCGVKCTGASCANGVCRLVASPDGGVPAVGDFSCLAVDSQSVYVATGLFANAGGQIYKVPLTGGTPTTIAPAQARPHGIASDGTSVFWANYQSGDIMKSDTAGNNAAPIAMGQANPFNLVIDAANHVFWNNAGDGTVWQSDADGNNQVRLAAGLTPNHLGYLAVDATNVYFTDLFGGNVLSAPIGGARPPRLMAPPQARPVGVATDGVKLFWSNAAASPTTGAIVSLGLGVPTAKPTTLAMGLDNPNAVATDGTSVYWSESNATGSIMKVAALGTSTAVPLATNQNFPSCIALDTTSVYWINALGGAVSKTGK